MSKKFKIRRQFDATYNGAKGEVNEMESKTVPDMSLTVAQLYRNHTRNLHSDAAHHTPQYFGVEVPIFKDLTEAMEFSENLKLKADDVANEIVKTAHQKAEKQAKTASQKSLEKRKAELDKVEKEKFYKKPTED